ncbi:MAG: DUF115 domain-containing protein [Lachnospiraceae bacterium]|nr:DUF115 domain-containing protein [Lachnospiraceae bacterium]
MAETFIEEIYKEACIIEDIKEYIEHINAARPREARVAYNRAMQELERILPELVQTDAVLAEQIQNTAVNMSGEYEDSATVKGLAEGKLLPLLFRYMENYTGIEVQEGQYLIKSAESGFLTVRDQRRGIALHDVHDPMWEARQMARELYEPQMQEFHILGCGLGYLPYQLWSISEGALKLFLYEEDEQILAYAEHYGVLSWIPEECIQIIGDTKDKMSGRLCLSHIFEQAVNNSKVPSGYKIMPWKKESYRDIDGGMISALAANQELYQSMRYRTAVNLWKNRMHEQITFEGLKKQYAFTEWIVVSAGPSLDEQIRFLLESRGQRGIVAVNTVLRRLFKEGIRPDLVAAADQYIQMVEHIEGIGEQTAGIPMIAERRVNWQYLQQYRGKVCFISTDEDDPGNNDDEIWNVSGSVAGVALEAAARLGAKKVYLVGQDLAYPDGRTYAAGMPYATEGQSRGTMPVTSVDDGTVLTSEAFNWFRIGLETQIARHPDIAFVNLSKHGALIRGCVKD